jgi:hypothetical protein
MVSIERKGKIRQAHYWVEGSLIFVDNGRDRMMTHLGSHSPETLASVLLGEMIPSKE